MKLKNAFLILISSLHLSFISFGQSVDQLKMRLEAGIRQSDAFAAADAIDGLRKLDVDQRGFPLDSAADLIVQKGITAYLWDPITGSELVRLFEPLEGLFDGDSARNHFIHGCYFWGLMGTGDRAKALGLWSKSEKEITSLFDTHYMFDRSGLSGEESRAILCRENALHFFVMGFLLSPDERDKALAIRLARQYYQWIDASAAEGIPKIDVDNSAIMAQRERIVTDNARSLLVYSLIESGMAADSSANPFLAGQPATSIHFERCANTGFEEHDQRIRLDNVIALGDYDDDSFVDVLVPGQGLWHNEKGSGKFKRVDKKLSIDIDGTSGAFADVNNDGLVDIIIVGPGKCTVHLQNKDHTFRTIVNSPEVTLKSPRGIGLFDGDADGLIDLYVCGYEESPDMVLRNKGDGTFENVTETWGFTGEDIFQTGRGVSPADYDSDGYTDIYVSNYRLKRNTLWHHVKENGKVRFVQCASAPWFGMSNRPEPAEGADRGVEGWHSTFENNTYWGNTLGSVWGDINNDGNLDLICANLAHPRYLNQGFSDISRVYLNSGNSFEDRTQASGLHFCETNGSPLLADFNNDGRLDFSMTNVYRMYYNQLYEGAGDGSFKEVTCHAGAFASNTLGQAAGDFDNDGDIDLFMVDGDRGFLLYSNTLIKNRHTPRNANWIEFKLHGKGTVNTVAYGARVSIKADKRIYIREVTGMRGISNCDDQVVHVGLGSYKGRVDVEIKWIGDRVQKIRGLKTGRRYEIEMAVNKAKGKRKK